MKHSLIPFAALICLAGCNNNNAPSFTADNVDQTVEATPKFLSTTGTDRYVSQKSSLRFGQDGTYELIEDRPVTYFASAQKTYDVECRIRFSGNAQFYTQKVGPHYDNGDELELNLGSGELLSSVKQAPIPASPDDLSESAICSQYEQALMAKKELDFTITEQDSDHLVLMNFDDDFNIPQSATKTDPNSKYLFSSYDMNSLGMDGGSTYFVKPGKQIDVTNQFLKRLNDDRYAEIDDKKITLSLSASLRELSISEPSCHITYLISIQSITTNGGSPVLHGSIAENDSTPVDPKNPNQNCDDLNTTLSQIPTNGLDIDGYPNECSDTGCSEMHEYIAIGKPGSNTGDTMNNTDLSMWVFTTPDTTDFRDGPSVGNGVF